MLESLTGWITEVVQSMSSNDQNESQPPSNNNETKGIDNPALELTEESEGGNREEKAEFAVYKWAGKEEESVVDKTEETVANKEEVSMGSCDEASTGLNTTDNPDQYYTYKIPKWLEAPTSNGEKRHHVSVLHSVSLSPQPQTDIIWYDSEEPDPGVRADDISLAEQGDAKGSVGSFEYRDDPEDTRVDEDGDESYLVAAEEPVPEDVLTNQETAPTIGQLEVIFDYSGESSRMNVTVMRGLNLPSKDQGGASAWRLRILLYPKKQRTKTRIRETEEPVFKELFRFTRIRPHELVNTAIRFRLYAAERMRKERLVGEGLVKFSSMNTSAPQTILVKLVSRSEASQVTGGNASPYSSSSDLSASGDSNTSLQSLSHGGLPELLVGLTYNATTGRLAVELIKGSHFKQQAAGRAPDSYVRITLMSSSGFEMTKSKTSVRRGQPNPTFKETFIFQVAQFQLADVTLMFTVFNKRGMKRKETIGWFSMGLSNTSDEETSHWKEMRESKGHQVCRWHILSNK